MIVGSNNITKNNKRIAENTFFLYIRMLLIMLVSLYTSRVVLKVLGVEDFGIYNVVGGVVAMLNIIVNTLSRASTRFITFALGKDDKEELKQIFSTVICIHLLLAGLLVLVGETVGLWFVCNKLVIPAERMTAALWVYHSSILIAVVTFVNIPYNALIIAHERMGAFAYISIIEVFLKLLVAWTLIYTSQDKLIIYAVLLFVVQFLIRIVYGYYCSIHFPECKVKLVWNVQWLKKIFAYVGWTLNGSFAIVGYTQGINILLNLFFGPAVNAARAIAVQVEAAVVSFVQNFQTAVRPQIVKSYAMSDILYMHKLIIMSSKYGFFLMLLIVLPLTLCINPILKMWLGNVPEYTALFTRLVVINAVIESLSYPLSAAVMSTGKNKWYQIVTGGLLLLNLPLAYVFLQLGYPPQVTMEISIVITAFSILSRFLFVRHYLSVSLKRYVNEVVKYIVMVSITSILFPLCFHCYLDYGIIRLVLIFMVSTLSIALSIYVVGVSKPERQALNRFLITKYYNIISRK